DLNVSAGGIERGIGSKREKAQVDIVSARCRQRAGDQCITGVPTASRRADSVGEGDPVGAAIAKGQRAGVIEWRRAERRVLAAVGNEIGGLDSQGQAGLVGLIAFGGDSPALNGGVAGYVDGFECGRSVDSHWAEEKGVAVDGEGFSAIAGAIECAGKRDAGGG